MARPIPPTTVGIGARIITTGADVIKGQTSEGFGGAFDKRYRRKFRAMSPPNATSNKPVTILSIGAKEQSAATSTSKSTASNPQALAVRSRRASMRDIRTVIAVIISPSSTPSAADIAMRKLLQASTLYAKFGSVPARPVV